MNIKITGKELKATDAIKEYAERKLERVQKYFENEIDVLVTIRTERNVQIAEIQVNVNSDMFRAVTETKDLYASIDKDIDILEGQIRKTKTKKDRQNKEASIKQKELLNTQSVQTIEKEIIKTTYYDIKPISVEDAKLKLEEKQNSIFHVFINIDTGKVNVIYKLKDSNNYGVIEPEA